MTPSPSPASPRAQPFGDAGLWWELAVGPPSHSGRVVRAEGLTGARRRAWTEPVFRSYYAFARKGKAYIEKHGSPSGFSGDYYLPRVVFDLDGDEDRLGAVHERARRFCRCLMGLDVPADQIRPYFSGGKGFHIETPDLFGLDPGPDLPERARASVESFTDESDTAPLSRTGLIRTPFSHHAGSGLYKIPLTLRELLDLDMERILEWAADPMTHRSGFAYPVCESDLAPVLGEYRAEGPRRSQVVSAAAPPTEKKEKAPDYLTCMWHLLEEGPQKGHRHRDLLRLMASWSHRGLSYEQMQTLGQQFLGSNRADFPDKEIQDMAARAAGVHASSEQRWSKYRCSDKVMDHHCDKRCILYRYRDTEDKIVDPGDALGQLEDVLSMGEEEGVRFSAAFEGCRYRILPGEVAVLIGDTGLGKSAFYQCLSVGLAPRRILDLSTEMPEWLHLRRYLQIAHGLRVREDGSLNEVKEAAQEGALRRLQRAVSHIQIVTESPTTDSIERLVRQAGAEVLVVDPIEKIRLSAAAQRGGGGLLQAEAVMRALKDLARRLSIVVLCVNHVNKNAQRKGGRRLNLADSKGVKVVTEEANHVFAFEGQRFTNRRRVRLLKATRPQKLNLALDGDPETYRFTPQRAS